MRTRNAGKGNNHYMGMFGKIRRAITFWLMLGSAITACIFFWRVLGGIFGCHKADVDIASIQASSRDIS